MIINAPAEDEVDYDIVSQTPERVHKKRRKLRKLFNQEYHVDVQDFLHCSRNDTMYFSNIRESRKFGGGDDTKYKPFVYSTIEEVLCFSEENFPVNNNLHIIGIYDRRDEGLYLISPFEKTTFIQLEFLPKLTVPNVNDHISAYGSVELGLTSTNILKMSLIVKFWTKESKDLLQYSKLLSLQRNFIPKDCLDTVKATLDDNSFLNSFSFCNNATLYCASDSVFTKNMTLIDNVCSEQSVG